MPTPLHRKLLIQMAEHEKKATFRLTKKHSETIVAELARQYPDARCALDFRNLFELTVATILSAQCTDKRVNMVTPRLFEAYPDAASLAHAEPAKLESIIHSTGFYKAKAKNLIAMAKGLVEKHGGQVPENMEELTKLAGVGRKTANVVLGVGCGKAEGIVVDTHVTRLSRRMGLTKQQSAVPIERDLLKLVPQQERVLISLRMIDHGRAVCKAGRPACNKCSLETFCPKIGVEPKPKGTKTAKPAKPLKLEKVPKAEKMTKLKNGNTSRKKG
jgi:endonuclease III